MRTNIFSYLRDRVYPGRGILLGRSPNGKYGVCAYFIMGRSENSRNRIFETTEGGIRTTAFDESKMTDPSLIIYQPVRLLEDSTLIISNGVQTDAIADAIAAGGTMRESLKSFTFEPDEPNWTPRISGVMYPNGNYELSILRTADGDPKSCWRFFFEYENPRPGTGHFISTYTDDGEPLPAFSGVPIFTDIRQKDPRELARMLWDAMNEDNRVSLFAAWVDFEDCIVDEVIINAHPSSDAE